MAIIKKTCCYCKQYILQTIRGKQIHTKIVFSQLQQGSYRNGSYEVVNNSLLFVFQSMLRRISDRCQNRGKDAPVEEEERDR